MASMDLSISQYLSRSQIAVSAQFGRLKIWTVGVIVSSDFCNGW